MIIIIQLHVIHLHHHTVATLVSMFSEESQTSGIVDHKLECFM